MSTVVTLGCTQTVCYCGRCEVRHSSPDSVALVANNVKTFSSKNWLTLTLTVIYTLSCWADSISQSCFMCSWCRAYVNVIGDEKIPHRFWLTQTMWQTASSLANRVHSRAHLPIPLAKLWRSNLWQITHSGIWNFQDMIGHIIQHIPSNSAGPTPTMMMDMGSDDACGETTTEARSWQSKRAPSPLK